jgi:hypothetical protein
MGLSRFRVVLIGLAATVAAVVLVAVASARSGPSSPPRASHVLLLSVDGLHQSDLTWYVDQHPKSALASLVHG